MLAHVGEQRAAVDVADRVEPRQARHAQLVVDLDLDACGQADGVESDVAAVRPAACGHQQLVGADRIAAFELERDLAVPADGACTRAGPDVDADRLKRRGDLVAHERLLP